MTHQSMNIGDKSLFRTNTGRGEIHISKWISLCWKSNLFGFHFMWSFKWYIVGGLPVCEYKYDTARCVLSGNTHMKPRYLNLPARYITFRTSADNQVSVSTLFINLMITVHWCVGHVNTTCMLLNSAKSKIKSQFTSNFSYIHLQQCSVIAH